MKVKHIINKIILGLMLIVTFMVFGVINSNAVTRGSFTMGFSGPSTAGVGEEILVSVIIKDMSEGVSGAGATLNFDTTALQLIDKTDGSALAMSYNDQNIAKFIGISAGSTVTVESILVTYKFKTLKEGTTSITLSDLSSTNFSYQSMNVTPEVYTVTVNNIPSKITSNQYGHTLVDDYIMTTALNTTGLAMKNQLDNDNQYLEVWDAGEQNRISDTDILGTGMIVKLIINGTESDRKLIVIKGEVTGDGSIEVSDAFRVIQHALDNDPLTGAFLKAADTTDDGSVEVSDAFRIIQHALDNDPFVWFVGGNI